MIIIKKLKLLKSIIRNLNKEFNNYINSSISIELDFLCYKTLKKKFIFSCLQMISPDILEPRSKLRRITSFDT